MVHHFKLRLHLNLYIQILLGTSIMYQKHLRRNKTTRRTNPIVSDYIIKKHLFMGRVYNLQSRSLRICICRRRSNHDWEEKDSETSIVYEDIRGKRQYRTSTCLRIFRKTNRRHGETRYSYQ